MMNLLIMIMNLRVLQLRITLLRKSNFSSLRCLLKHSMRNLISCIVSVLVSFNFEVEVEYVFAGTILLSGTVTLSIKVPSCVTLNCE
jgi:hypothetical protein